jgi:hypothetical protein
MRTWCWRFAPLLVLVSCLATSIPGIGQEQAAQITLHAEWIVELKTLVRSAEVFGYVAGVAVTNNRAVISFVSFCANSRPTTDCITIHLASFDRSTGRIRESIEIKPNKLYSYAPQLLEATATTFLAQQANELTEYNDRLKPTNHIRLPRGMSVVLQPGYAHGWAETAQSDCATNGAIPVNFRQQTSAALVNPTALHNCDPYSDSPGSSNQSLLGSRSRHCYAIK